MCFVVIAILAIYVFFLLTLQKAMGRCSRRNRTMEPGLVWLLLVPLFNIVWIFIMPIRIGDSLKNEFADREIDDGSNYGKSVGLWWAAATGSDRSC